MPKDTWRFVLLCFEATLFLLPIYWMLATSFKPEPDTTALPIQLFPVRPTLANYDAVLNSPEGSIFRWTFNSLFAALAHAGAHVVVSLLAAYPLARMRFRGRDKWFWIILSSLMLPAIMLLLPTYIMVLKLGWIDTPNPLIWPAVPSVFGDVVTSRIRGFMTTTSSCCARRSSEFHSSSRTPPASTVPTVSRCSAMC